jgi:hypothetical protein
MRSGVAGRVGLRCRAVRRLVLAELNIQAEVFRAVGQQVSVGETHELAGELAGRNCKAQFWPDTGRLAGREGYTRKGRTQSLYST